MPGTNIAYGGTVLRQPAVRCAVLTSRMTVTADDGGRAAALPRPCPVRSCHGCAMCGIRIGYAVAPDPMAM
eukprot:1632059-Rhodomonas_salina.1